MESWSNFSSVLLGRYFMWSSSNLNTRNARCRKNPKMANTLLTPSHSKLVAKLVGEFPCEFFDLPNLQLLTLVRHGSTLYGNLTRCTNFCAHTPHLHSITLRENALSGAPFEWNRNIQTHYYFSRPSANPGHKLLRYAGPWLCVEPILGPFNQFPTQCSYCCAWWKPSDGPNSQL